MIYALIRSNYKVFYLFSNLNVKFYAQYAIKKIKNTMKELKEYVIYVKGCIKLYHKGNICLFMALYFLV